MPKPYGTASTRKSTTATKRKIGKVTARKTKPAQERKSTTATTKKKYGKATERKSK